MSVCPTVAVDKVHLKITLNGTQVYFDASGGGGGAVRSVLICGQKMVPGALVPVRTPAVGSGDSGQHWEGSVSHPLEVKSVFILAASSLLKLTSCTARMCI